MDDVVSVIIPTFNRAGTIIRAIQSVLSQTHSAIDLIVVDDCSADNTALLVSKIHDSRLRYCCLPKNSGACVARNCGVAMARGEYTTFLDSDDEYLPQKVERQLFFLRQQDCDVVICRMATFSEAGAFLHNFPKESVGAGSLSYESLLQYNSCSTQLLFAKTAVVQAIQFDPMMPRMQDWDEVLRISQKHTVFYQKEVLVNTYIQKDSITQNPQKGLDALALIYQKHKLAIEQSPASLAYFALKRASLLKILGQPYEKELFDAARFSHKPKDALRYILHKLGLK